MTTPTASTRRDYDADRRFLRDDQDLTAVVSKIERDDDGCYRWTVTDEHDTVTYRTSPNGDGVWLDEGHATLDRQILGIADFDLSGVTAETRRRRVVRRFATDPR